MKHIKKEILVPVVLYVRIRLGDTNILRERAIRQKLTII